MLNKQINYSVMHVLFIGSSTVTYIYDDMPLHAQSPVIDGSIKQLLSLG